MARLSTLLMNIVLLIIVIQLLPPFITSLKQHYHDWHETKSHVGVVTIDDALITNTNSYAHELKKMFKDPLIKAIVLKIDSPGGTPAACQELFYEINELKKEYVKPVIAYAENFCTSGSYYIACAADHIITQPATFVGTIGVYLAFPNFHEFLQDHKISYTAIKTGTYKSPSLYLQELTPDQKKMFQSITDDTYAQFVNDVMARRPHLAKIDKAKWADGKTFTGRQALELGLIDELGSQSALIRTLRAKAALEGEIVWVHKPQAGFLSFLFSSKDSSEYESSKTQSIGKSVLHSLIFNLMQPQCS